MSLSEVIEPTGETPEQTAEAAGAQHAGHEHDEHQHGDHQHAGHQHGPALNPELTREIAVEAPAEEVTEAFRGVVKRYQKLARIPGFRAGKVPESLIRGRFGRDIRQEVMEQLVQERFRKAIEEQGVAPISQPQVTELLLVDGQPLKFRAQVEVLPQIDLAGYESVTVEKPTTSVSDEEFQAELDRLLDSHATVEPVEEQRPLADGDWAEIKFHGVRQRPTPAAEGETAGAEPTPADEANEIEGEDILVEIGGKNTLPAFNEALRGRSAGQEFELDVEYPADFGDVRLAGQTVHYDVTVQAIKRKVFPERDAELAKQFGNHESWEAFTEDLRGRIGSRKQQAAEADAKGKLVDGLVEKFQFPVPETFVQQQIDVRLDRGLRALAQQGMTEEQMRQLDFARLREAQREEAVKEVRASLILDRIAEQEKIEPSEEDVQREAMMLSLQAREPFDKVRERLAANGTLDRIREQLRRERTATHLYEKLA